MNVLQTDAGVTIVTALLTSEDTRTRWNLVPAQADRLAGVVREQRDINAIHRDLTYITADPHARSMLLGALCFAINEAKRQVAAILQTARAEGLVR